MAQNIRNVAIIAHVDHGKTTLVDGLLRQTGTFRSNQAVGECVMDSNELEKERGITILAKNTVVEYQGTHINIIDTPGHADFGGEVERVLSMADGVLLLVDAAEGPMPQTRFVLQKAFSHHLKPIVVVNKIDKPDARPQEVVNEVFDLFIDLDADEQALEFPVFYGSGRQGWMTSDLAAARQGGEGKNLQSLFDAIVGHIPAPKDDPNAPLQFRVTTLDWSDYVGRIAIGRVHRGRMRPNERVVHLSRTGSQKEVNVRGVYRFVGLGREETTAVDAGDLCGVYGIENIEIGDTLAAVEHPEAMPVIAIDEPTMTIVMRVNDSPFAGKDGGKFMTSRHLRDRLEKELRVNVALRVEPGDGADSFKLSGRGVMHLGFLLETMRREGYEFAVQKPQVLFKDIDGEKHEPIEYLTVDAPADNCGKVIEILGTRRAELLKMDRKGTFTRLEFTVPARGLIGVRSRLLNATAGQATMHHVFHGYGPFRGTIEERTAGVLVSMAQGQATFYALDGLRDRGSFFVPEGGEIYEGMLVGEHCKDNDLVVNVVREKKATNVRSSTKETFVKLPPPRSFNVEDALEYVGDDELVEITAKSVRLRKFFLKETDRKRNERRSETV
ncbi:MAG: translational GTPase TypA [Planctomycetes bacterium]|nr:translational GTPase TypA [Planctomycetota bacterium]MCC7396618.1 translational GTPase TypA [Planctomycetota bacterium]